MVPCDFLVAARSETPSPDDRHEILLANCLAQAEAMARGRTLEQVREELAAANLSPAEVDSLAPHKVMMGNRASTTMLYPRLDPAQLGAIISLYEHRVFVQGVIWGIDSFDQWGVELGKVLANNILPGVLGDTTPSGDATSRRLTEHIAAMRAE